ncbi:MAG: aminomethyl-transferring glycine dehydrogenase subunit GcvPA [Bacteroidales bacterium]|jgi:glycine dehydrogenase subunit 1|nr:aminomethyl-transferring glycine dehydrogenase subunit GcvPA [Bacteroidales bacterium]
MSNFAYFPHTDDDIREMLDRIGVGSVDDLYGDVPADFMYRGDFGLPDAMSEQQVREFFEKLDSKDSKLKVFAGAGAYDHYTPAVIPYIVSRSEFLTAYTPYQAEISQGTLRYIFEYQSMMCILTGMDAGNASLYDGPTAAAEAARMALSCTKHKTRILISRTLLPNVIDVIETYSGYHGIQLGYISEDKGQTSLSSLNSELSKGDVAGIIVPGINKYGVIEDLSGYADAVHDEKGVMIEYCDPSSLAVIKTPGDWNADIAVGDGQSLGIPLCFGGPYVGFMTCKKEYVRKMPGRVVGETRDSDGKRCFVLTLQAREQHIRREKATSNICSNESLMALFVTVYLSLMGKEGMKRVNDLSYGKAHRLYSGLLETGLFSDVFHRPFLNEFTLESKIPANELQRKLMDAGFFAAIEVGEGLVSFCVTEKRTEEEIDALLKTVKEVRL